MIWRIFLTIHVKAESEIFKIFSINELWKMLLKYEDTRLHIVWLTISSEYMWLIDLMSTFVDFASLKYSRLFLDRNFHRHDWEHEFWSLN